MSFTATVRVMAPEEIAARAGGSTPYLQWPNRATVFAERGMRLKQRAADHPLGDYLRFVAALALAQQSRLNAMPALPLPSAEQLDRAAQGGMPPLPAAEWPRDPAWHAVLREMVSAVRAQAPAATQPTLQALLDADAEWLERQADCLLTGVSAGLDMAAAPVIAAALQVCWTHLLLETQSRASGEGQPFARIDEGLVCPCCGSRPVASIAKSGGDFNGQRYLHCSLCSLQWHLPRGQCSHCASTKAIFYQSLSAATADEDDTARATQSAVQAEICDACDHYLKLMHTERDAMVEPVADDLATLTLDLLVSDTGKLAHGINFMLLFGDPPPPEPPPDSGPGQP